MTLLAKPESQEVGKKYEEEKMSIPFTKMDLKDKKSENQSFMMARSQFRQAAAKMSEIINRKLLEKFEKSYPISKRVVLYQ